MVGLSVTPEELKTMAGRASMELLEVELQEDMLDEAPRWESVCVEVVPGDG